MAPNPRKPPLTVIDGGHEAEGASGRGHDNAGASRPREIDWSILMAHAQAGDSDAYRRLLSAISPYLRGLAARRHRDPRDIEDVVQDILLTLHAVRHTYDPTRPFGPWLHAIANRRLIDRIRRHARIRWRELPLLTEHETFPADQANLDDELSDRRELGDAIATLPSSQRQAIQLLKLKEMSLNEAAAASGMTVAALKIAAHRGLRSLRKMISKRDLRS